MGHTSIDKKVVGVFVRFHYAASLAVAGNKPLLSRAVRLSKYSDLRPYLNFSLGIKGLPLILLQGGILQI
jgi:hypothetical protein